MLVFFLNIFVGIINEGVKYAEKKILQSALDNSYEVDAKVEI